MRDRNNPSFFDAMRVDPHLSLSLHERALYEKDVNRGIRRFLLPICRLLMIGGIMVLRFVKRLLPFTLKSHTLLNRLGVWFMRDCISPQALEYIIRHFQYETALINFVSDNCGSEAVKKVNLMPTRVSDLGSVEGINAIVLHDINIYNHVIDTGSHDEINVKHQIPLDKIKYTALELPVIDVDENHRRYTKLDIETSSYIMVFFLVLFLSDEEGERAAQSLQLDESLLNSLSNLTGDEYFRRLSPMRFTHWIRYHFDPVKDLRWHMMTIDFAYNKLKEIQSQQSQIANQKSEALPPTSKTRAHKGTTESA